MLTGVFPTIPFNSLKSGGKVVTTYLREGTLFTGKFNDGIAVGFILAMFSSKKQ